jgi:hypothetical protein
LGTTSALSTFSRSTPPVTRRAIHVIGQKGTAYRQFWQARCPPAIKILGFQRGLSMNETYLTRN